MLVWCSLLANSAMAQEPNPQRHDADSGVPGALLELEESTPVVGGDQVENGDWDQVALVVGRGGNLCTGTLIGPKVVLTAEHCVDQGVDGIMFETKDYIRQVGTYVEDLDGVEVHPEGGINDGGYDIALVFLDDRAPVEPSPIALDCILRDHLEDGSNGWMVGFGATRSDGGGRNSALNEAQTQIVDADCDEDFHEGTFMGCFEQIAPGGEVAGFSDDAHVCFGDSGGPLFLRTRTGPYVVGVASRLFLGSPANAPCSDGSIWVRPDAVIDWIEDVKGNRRIEYPSCNEAPTLEVPDMVTDQELPVTVEAEAVDPDGDVADIVWEIAEEPGFGTASVDEDGQITYTPDEDFFGEDVFTVRITDRGTPRWERTAQPLTAEVEVPVTVVQAACGCAIPGALPTGLGILMLLPLGLLRRREG